MIDIKLIRQDREAVEKKLKTKEPSVNLTEIVALDDKLRHLIVHVEGLKAKRNDASKKIGELKREGKDTSAVMESVSAFADDIHTTDQQINELQARLNDLLAHLPNLPIDEIKVSPDPKDNVEIRRWGEKRAFDFTPKNHLELSDGIGLFDFKRGAKISGAGWPVYRGLGARLEWALLNYMLDVNRKNGFE
ncbi:MAG: serine--tRNA ligase, partial [Chlamydiia bacterium]|nr:serine--tRNA ligase [Chlamydiia bacterium]